MENFNKKVSVEKNVSKDNKLIILSQKKLGRTIAIFVSVLIAFIAGEALGSNYALLKEMQLHEQILVRNLSIFSKCKSNQCNQDFQESLVQENDIAIQQYTLLEATSKSILNRGFWYTIGPLAFAIYNNQSVTPSERLRGYYEKLGCGINGVICQNTKTEAAPSHP